MRPEHAQPSGEWRRQSAPARFQALVSSFTLGDAKTSRPSSSLHSRERLPESPKRNLLLPAKLPLFNYQVFW